MCAQVGHALHTLLARTQLQHTSGTRGPMDFVEIPSHLLEHFGRDPHVLRLLSGHAQTGERLPQAMAASLASCARVSAAR